MVHLISLAEQVRSEAENQICVYAQDFKRKEVGKKIDPYAILLE